MAERVVITGLGVISALGCNCNDFWSNLVKGVVGISKITAFDTSHLERHYGGQIQNFNPNDFSSTVRTLPRSQQFAVAASKSALRDANASGKKEIDVVLGSIVSGLEFLEKKHKSFENYPIYKVTANVSKTLALQGAVFTVSGACAAGNYAISMAYERIKRGETEVVLAGGADYFSEGTFIGLYKVFSIAPCMCQPFDKNRKGLIPAEGAGMLVLESLSSAKKRAAPIYAEVLGYGISADAYHPLIPYERGIYNCMKNALKSTGLIPADIDYISAHGTGTIPNDKTECAAIRKLFGKKTYRKVPASSIKSMLGHTMGAASAIEAIACCMSITTGIIPPTMNYETPDPECDIDCVPNKARKHKTEIVLNNAFGFGGMNCSLVLGRY
ncbi:MAG: beta-ketoacyl-[acyl-carrier-protein] synthase family protein [Candidatus Omnitrophica bacterium]|nr:beta-ketoacyl-[acyl-carrier-protein] synthase family protein [Candidatus Omnitrophota bacterium]